MSEHIFPARDAGDSPPPIVAPIITPSDTRLRQPQHVQAARQQELADNEQPEVFSQIRFAWEDMTDPLAASVRALGPELGRRPLLYRPEPPHKELSEFAEFATIALSLGRQPKSPYERWHDKYRPRTGWKLDENRLDQQTEIVVHRERTGDTWRYRHTIALPEYPFTELKIGMCATKLGASALSLSWSNAPGEKMQELLERLHDGDLSSRKDHDLLLSMHAQNKRRKTTLSIDTFQSEPFAMWENVYGCGQADFNAASGAFEHANSRSHTHPAQAFIDAAAMIIGLIPRAE